MERDGKAEFDASRIQGAQYFDINAIADLTTDLPHMMPSGETFETAAGAMGISENDEIIVYDGPGLFSSARVWWTFRTMGASNVKILKGGFDGWKSAGLPVETGAPTEPAPSIFKASFKGDKVRDYVYMKSNVKRGDTLVLDARPFGRFAGEVPEPRAGLKSGHIPGSKSLPAMELIKDGALLLPEELEARFAEVGIANADHVTTTCGSGVTAAILSLALDTLGHKDHSLYDGSWADWGSRSDAPVAKWE
mgnify:CR=1 FL=1